MAHLVSTFCLICHKGKLRTIILDNKSVDFLQFQRDFTPQVRFEEAFI